jgi:pre-mRNA-splicing factor SYF1
MSAGQDNYGDDQLAEAVKFNFKFWWAKLTALHDRSYKDRAAVFLRSLKHLPGSYKLWHHFLTESVTHCEGKCIISASFTTVNALFDRCLVFMHKMPRIWIMYLEFILSQRLHNKLRATLDRVSFVHQVSFCTTSDPAP